MTSALKRGGVVRVVDLFRVALSVLKRLRQGERRGEGRGQSKILAEIYQWKASWYENDWEIQFTFQVATNSRGRGVLRLILQQQQINILLVLVIATQLVILAFPTWKAPKTFCVSFDIILRFVLIVRYLFNFTIASGRYLKEHFHS